MTFSSFNCFLMALQYYESLVLEIKEETEKEISEAINKAVSLKLQKFQIKLDKCLDEKKFMEDVSHPIIRFIYFVSLLNLVWPFAFFFDVQFGWL